MASGRTMTSGRYCDRLHASPTQPEQIRMEQIDRQSDAEFIHVLGVASRASRHSALVWNRQGNITRYHVVRGSSAYSRFAARARSGLRAPACFWPNPGLAGSSLGSIAATAFSVHVQQNISYHTQACGYSARGAELASADPGLLTSYRGLLGAHGVHPLCTTSVWLCRLATAPGTAM